METKHSSALKASRKATLVRGAPVVRKVLDAALEELSGAGYAAMRIEDVALRAGVNKTTVYRRWATKDELVRTLLLSLASRSLSEIPDTGSLRSDLLQFARQRKQELQSPEGRALFCMLAATNAHTEVKAIAEAAQRVREQASRTILERAVTRGELRPNVNAQPVFDVLRAVALSRALTPGRALDEKRLRAIVDALLYGVLGESARDRKK